MNTLAVVTGPTASGKTALAIALAEALGTDIVSADSRQMFRDIPIATAQPTPDELRRVHHHHIATLPLDAYYSAARYEEEVLALLPRLWQRSPVAVMAGGSMMYVDAVTRGIDPLPEISPDIRRHVRALYEEEGLDAVADRLLQLDPRHYVEVDRRNPRRVMHALEICLQAGVPYSQLRTGRTVERPWRTVTMVIDYPREELFDRINRRVDTMVAAGLVDEARRVYPLRHLNALNTVGLKEIFAYLDGTMTLPEAIERIKKNTRVYAKKQLTWLARRPDIIHLDPARPLLPQALAHLP